MESSVLQMLASESKNIIWRTHLNYKLNEYLPDSEEIKHFSVHGPITGAIFILIAYKIFQNGQENTLNRTDPET